MSAGSEEGKQKASRLRIKQSMPAAEGSLLDTPNKVFLKGLASNVLSSSLAGKADTVDAISCRGIFDRSAHDQHRLVNVLPSCTASQPARVGAFNFTNSKL